jgi:iron complex outermembrane recepter protein
MCRWGVRLVACLVVGATYAAVPGGTGEPHRDEVPLEDLLPEFARRSGLNLVYVAETVRGRKSRAIDVASPPEQALTQLLAGTGLAWRRLDASRIAIYEPEPEPVHDDAPKAAVTAARRADDGFAVLPDMNVLARTPWIDDGRTEAAGLARSLYETPRSVDVVPSALIEDLSLTAVEDLLVAVPGVFTTTRFGVQGSVDIRGVPADTYFRGMKRLTLQGHARSVLAAMDSIEVVAGPASTLFGPGKIGGYTNMVPKSGRARSGRYLQEPEGFVQLIGGRYGRRELSGGTGGPLAGEHAGGYYVYGMREDSDTFVDGVPVQQAVLQAAMSIDDAFGGARLETGVNLQESVTAGALVGRLTQDLVSDNEYIGGVPLVDLDANDNGRIGYLEMVSGSPVRGSLSIENQPLSQVFPWPRAPDGSYLPLDRFPRVAGIPQSLYAYLLANPEADPTGLLRAQGAGGPVPVSGAVPIGMALDPRTIHTGPLERRHSAAFERELRARFVTAYADLIDDQDPDRTFRNQLFFDGMDQTKSSNQPYSQVQRVFVVEDKVTAGRRFWADSSHVHAVLQGTANLRHTDARGRFTLGDYGNHRSDGSAADWDPDVAGMTPNSTFSSANEHPTLQDDGLPWGNIFHTRITEIGAGLLLDLELGTRLDVALGARHDFSHAANTVEAGRFNFNTGTTANPGAYLNTDDEARAWDDGTSWSASVAFELDDNLRPYATYSQSSLLLDGNNNSLLNPVIRAGHLGSGSLREAGVRSRWFGGRLRVDAAAFEQGRTDVDAESDVNVINAYATATTSRGWQLQAKYAHGERGYLAAYLTRNVTRYTPNVGGLLQVDARALGFEDVRDAAGNVVYPAEAFLYGGRARIQLPNGIDAYSRKQGNPPTQAGMTALWRITGPWLTTARAQYLSDTCAGRLCLVELPQSLVVDLGVQFSGKHHDFKLDVFNAGDRRYFRARTGDTLGDVIAQAMPGRRWQLTARYRF